MPQGGRMKFEELLELLDGRDLPLALNIKADDTKDSDWIQVMDRRLSTGEIQKSHNNRIFLNKNDIFFGLNSENIDVETKNSEIDI